MLYFEIRRLRHRKQKECLRSAGVEINIMKLQITNGMSLFRPEKEFDKTCEKYKKAKATA